MKTGIEKERKGGRDSERCEGREVKRVRDEEKNKERLDCYNERQPEKGRERDKYKHFFIVCFYSQWMLFLLPNKVLLALSFVLFLSSIYPFSPFSLSFICA